MARGKPEPDPADALFALPLEEFVEARNRLAAELGRAGDKARAAEIKALAKPSLSAWAANQVYWQARPLYDALQAASAKVRASAGADLRAALEARRAALQAAARRAGELLAVAGSAPGPDMLRRVSNTLEAIATLEPAPDRRPGRLARDVDPPGFDALTALAASDAPSRVLAFRAPGDASKSQRAAAADRARQSEAALAAQRALAEAEKTLRAARAQAAAAQRAAAKARAGADAAERERRELEESLAAATARAQTRSREARELERRLGEAEQSVQAAEIDAARARARVPTD